MPPSSTIEHMSFHNRTDFKLDKLKTELHVTMAVLIHKSTIKTYTKPLLTM